MNLREQVFAALDNAVENGYEDSLRACTVAEAADGLLDYDSNLAEYTQADLVPYVLEWMTR